MIHVGQGSDEGLKGILMVVKKVFYHATPGLQEFEGGRRPSTSEDNPRPAKIALICQARIEALKRGFGKGRSKGEVLQVAGDIRVEEVHRLRDSIERGEYDLDPEKIAGKMIEELW